MRKTMMIGAFSLSLFATSAWAGDRVEVAKEDKAGAQLGANPKADRAASAKWSVRMHDLYRALAELVTDLSSDERFNSPARKPVIERNAGKIAKLAHEIKGAAPKGPDQDPTIGILAGLFDEEAKRAHQELKRGNRAYARSILRGMAGYCIACHTKSKDRIDFASLPMAEGAEKLKPLEKAQFFMATHQYDRANQEIQRILGIGPAAGGAGPSADRASSTSSTFEWERAARYGMVLAVRVKRDPVAALDIAERVAASPKSPTFLKKDAVVWMESLAQWKEQGTRAPTSEEGYRAEAIRLVAAAHDAQKYPMDHSGDALYLQATDVIHQLLKLAPNGRYAAEALFLAGVSYEALRDLNIGDFHEMYYQACIRKAPHSEIAENCYRKFEQSVYAGYTGSAGTELPGDVAARLTELRKLAQPAAENGKPRLD